MKTAELEAALIGVVIASTAMIGWTFWHAPPQESVHVQSPGCGATMGF
jgi:predicted negative regulator of RcsB-dependent stress response